MTVTATSSILPTDEGGIEFKEEEAEEVRPIYRIGIYISHPLREPILIRPKRFIRTIREEIELNDIKRYIPSGHMVSWAIGGNLLTVSRDSVDPSPPALIGSAEDEDDVSALYSSIHRHSPSKERKEKMLLLLVLLLLAVFLTCAIALRRSPTEDRYSSSALKMPETLPSSSSSSKKKMNMNKGL